MKLVWSPETAPKAYIDTVKSCRHLQESCVAEVVSAMAAGWNTKLVVETWSQSSEIATRHTGGRHICVVPDEESSAEYAVAMIRSGYSSPAYEMIAGEAEEAMEGLQGIDFLVVDCSGNDFARIIRVANLGHSGAVLICKNSSSKVAPDFRWHSALDEQSRVVRSVFLPVGKGLGITHIAATGGKAKGERRWVKGIDQESGEEFVIRK